MAGTEAAAELLAMDIADSEVSLFLAGSWKGTVTAASGIAFTELGAVAAASEAPLLYTQEVDLSLELLVRRRWFVEASFLDDYALNTYRAGYRGLEGETVRYAGFGNVGLSFPEFPYLDLGGDAPNSFGAYAEFGSGDLSLHALVRYDSAVASERVYIGKCERTVSEKPVSARLRGRSFVLPDDALDAPPVVYIEDSQGSLRDVDGRRYREAVPSEHAASAVLGLVELAATPPGRVAVAYRKGGTASPWTASLGTYDDGSTAGTLFLGEVQTAFAEADPSILLSEYPQCGGGVSPATVLIEGTAALVIWEPGAFSPFERASLYPVPVSTSTSVTVSLSRSSTGDSLSRYEFVPVRLFMTDRSVTEGQVSGGQASPPASTGLASTAFAAYELVDTEAVGDRRAPASRWPLLSVTPRAFLPGFRGSSEDLAVRYSSFGAEGSYSIGTDVVPGSVLLTRDGVPDAAVSYDQASGIVTLQEPASLNEVIRIAFLKRSDERRFGSFAAGLGAIYGNEGPLSARAAFGLRWNVSDSAFSEAGESNPGTAGFGGEVAWKGKELAADLRLALRARQSDTTGLLRIAGMEGFDAALPLSESAAFPSPGASPLVYRDYRSSDLLGNTVLEAIEWDGAKVDAEKQGPYAVSDSGFGGGVLVAEFSLDGGAAPASTWTAFQNRIGSEAFALERAESLVLPYRFYGLSGSASFQVVFQAGSLADPDESLPESAERVWTKIVYDSATDPSPGEAWSLATLSLDDEDRRRLADVRSIRVKVILADGDPGTLSGRLLVGPPSLLGANFKPVLAAPGEAVSTAPDARIPSDRGVAASELPDSSLRSAYPTEIGRLHGSGESQRVLTVAWSGLSAGEAAGVDAIVPPVPLGDYRKLTLFIRGPRQEPGGGAFADGTTLRILLGNAQADTADSPSASPVLDVRVPASAFDPGVWTRLVVDYGGADPAVTAGGASVPGATVRYDRGLLAVNGGSDPSYVALLVEPPDASASLPAGSFAMDELCAEEGSFAWGASSGGSLEWKRSGPLLSVLGTDLLSDPALDAAFESAATLNNAASLVSGAAAAAEGTAAASGRFGLAATVLGARIGVRGGLSAGSFGTSWRAAHSVGLPLGPLSLEESFELKGEEELADRSFALSLAGPAAGRLSARAKAEGDVVGRTWQFSASGDPAAVEEGAPAPVLRAAAAATVAWTGAAENGRYDFGNYGAAWKESWTALLPDDGSGERKRDADFSASMDLDPRPVGLSASASATSAYSRADDSLGSSAAIGFSLPAKFGTTGAKFTARRSFARVDGDAGERAADDAEAFLASQAEALSLWSQAPFAALASPAAGEAFGLAAAGSTSASFEDGIELAVDRGSAMGISSLFVPSLAKIGIRRNLTTRLDTASDALKYDLSLSFAAVNLFGKLGSSGVFDFYRSDEFNHSASVAITTAKNEALEWTASLRQQAAFFGTGTSSLDLSNSVAFGSSAWSEGLIIGWKATHPKSFLSAVYSLASKGVSGASGSPALASLAKAEPKTERRESLELSVSDSSALTWKCAARHESIVRVDGRLSLSAFADLGISGGDRDAPVVAALSLGTSLALSF